MEVSFSPHEPVSSKRTKRERKQCTKHASSTSASFFDPNSSVTNLTDSLDLLKKPPQKKFFKKNKRCFNKAKNKKSPAKPGFLYRRRRCCDRRRSCKLAAALDLLSPNLVFFKDPQDVIIATPPVFFLVWLSLFSLSWWLWRL